MKKLMIIGIALFLVFSVTSAMAGDQSNSGAEPAAFQALSNLSAPGQVALQVMTDKELAAVEGQFVCFIAGACAGVNIATVNQANISVLSLGVVQANGSIVSQSN